MAPTIENSAQSNMTSEVDASVKNSNFEKCKWKKKKICKIIIFMLTEKQDFETSNKKGFRLLWEALDTSDSKTKKMNKLTFIVGKGGHTPPFSKISPFLKIQDVSNFHRSIGKTKVLNNSCNQFVYNFYPQSILILEECLQKWWDANLI